MTAEKSVIFDMDAYEAALDRLTDAVLRLLEVIEVEPPESINPEIVALAAEVRREL